MKMKKTDIGVVAFMYAVCAFFYAYSSKLTAESKTYPMFTIALLFALTTVESGADEVCAGFKPVQFIVSVVLTIVYFFMMKYLGFFTATIVFMVASLLYLKVRPVPMLISVVAMNLLIYFAFVKFLGVKLPSGLLF